MRNNESPPPVHELTQEEMNQAFRLLFAPRLDHVFNELLHQNISQMDPLSMDLALEIVTSFTSLHPSPKGYPVLGGAMLQLIVELDARGTSLYETLRVLSYQDVTVMDDDALSLYLKLVLAKLDAEDKAFVEELVNHFVGIEVAVIAPVILKVIVDLSALDSTVLALAQRYVTLCRRQPAGLGYVGQLGDSTEVRPSALNTVKGFINRVAKRR